MPLRTGSSTRSSGKMPRVPAQRCLSPGSANGPLLTRTRRATPSLMATMTERDAARRGGELAAVDAAASYFFTGGQFSNKTLLICWEHDHIPPIAQALVDSYFGPEVPLPPRAVVPPHTSWPENDYDTIWTFSLDGSGKPDSPQPLLRGYQYRQPTLEPLISRRVALYL